MSRSPSAISHGWKGESLAPLVVGRFFEDVWRSVVFDAGGLLGFFFGVGCFFRGGGGREG